MISTKKYHILVVDDEELVREVMCDYFFKNSYHVMEQESGNKAFHYLQNNHVDIVITDCKMPDGSGIDLIKMINSLPLEKQIPVIMVSGFSDIKPKDILDLGVKAFFEKPIDRKELLKKVVEILEENTVKKD